MEKITFFIKLLEHYYETTVKRLWITWDNHCKPLVFRASELVWMLVDDFVLIYRQNYFHSFEFNIEDRVRLLSMTSHLFFSDDVIYDRACAQHVWQKASTTFSPFKNVKRFKVFSKSGLSQILKWKWQEVQGADLLAEPSPELSLDCHLQSFVLQWVSRI